MKNVFDWTFQDAFTATNPLFKWVKQERPSQYEKNILASNGKEVHINSLGFVSENNTATFRYSRIQSEVVDIATVVIYPTCDSIKLPVFLSEWVLVQDKIHVIALDIEWVENSPYPALFYPQYQKFFQRWQQVFPEKKEKPQWFTEICSEAAIFSGSGITQAMQLQQLFNAYLERWMNWAEQHYPELLAGDDNDFVKNYKHHHYIHSPARTIIKGEHGAWLDIFLKDYHFA